jgi:predicted PurR-regulated permease PerM
MENTYIRFNIINMITITIMAALGISLLGLAQSALKSYKGQDMTGG